MLKNYFKIALRNLKKDKIFSFINIKGLGIGIAICLFLFLWVRNEISYDTFNKQVDNIYRVVWGKSLPLVGIPVAQTLSSQYPEVLRSTDLRKTKLVLKKDEQFIEQENVYYTDENFFKIFTVDFLKGDPASALTESGSLVLTQETARKFFPGKNPIGMTLTDNNGKIFKVTAVVKAFPEQSHFHFTMLTPIKDYALYQKRKDQWLSATVYSYLLLKDNTNIKTLESNFKNYVKTNVLKGKYSGYNDFTLQSLKDIHLKSDLNYELEPNVNMTYVYTFSFIAIFILLLAVINFTNITIARSIDRLNEIGVRKVLGSQRKQLIVQFLSETFLQVLFAFTIAVIIVELTIGNFNNLADRHLTLNIFSQPSLLLTIAFGILFLSIIAGGYPALYVSGFKPISVLRKQLNLKGGKESLRRSLIVFQFLVSTCLIASTVIVFNQMNFIQNKNLGFDKEHVLVISNAGSLLKHYDAFRNKLMANPGISGASLSMFLPGDDFDSMPFKPEQPANMKAQSFTYDMIDNHFVDVLKLKIVEGRNFSSNLASDSSAFLINEAAAKKIGWDNPVGKELSFRNVKGKVVGVVKDFNFMSLRTAISPIVFPFLRWAPQYVSIRLKPGDIQNDIQYVKELWNKFVPGRTFDYSFLDQYYAALYKNEEKMSKLFTLFSILAIFIAALGLLGLASFNVKKRVKEIGIRKILGATTSNILYLLSKEFFLLVLLANVIAVPVVWYMMNRWLHNFAYHVSITFTIFLISCILTVTIAILIVCFQALKTANANPVKSLRYE